MITRLKQKIYSTTDKITGNIALSNWIILTWWMTLILMGFFWIGLMKVIGFIK